MRTNFTLEDIKNIIDDIFNGNLWASKASDGKIPYANPNSEKILLIDEYDNTKTEIDLAEYLNITFYSWKQRVVETGSNNFDDKKFEVFEEWVDSLNFSMNQTYALVEKLDEEMTTSQDIDSATITGKITFLVQADKIKNLDYYTGKLRNKLLGVTNDIQNAYGDVLKAFINIGAIIYEQEPIMTQFGECIICSLNYRVSYLADAYVYKDAEIQISLDGDDLYNENGEIVDIFNVPTETKYLTMPITKATFQNIFTSNALPLASRPDMTGIMNTALTQALTISFFDFNKELTNQFNELFWRYPAYRVDGKISSVQEVNIPIYLRVKSANHSYVYKYVISNMQKSMTNNDFNVSSITLKTWGKNI